MTKKKSCNQDLGSKNVGSRKGIVGIEYCKVVTLQRLYVVSGYLHLIKYGYVVVIKTRTG